jgi:hypothetical protein
MNVLKFVRVLKNGARVSSWIDKHYQEEDFPGTQLSYKLGKTTMAPEMSLGVHVVPESYLVTDAGEINDRIAHNTNKVRPIVKIELYECEPVGMVRLNFGSDWKATCAGVKLIKLLGTYNLDGEQIT